MLILFVGILSAGAKKPSPKVRPAWVDDPQKEYKAETYLSSVGMGSTRAQAEAAATANLAAIFQADIQAAQNYWERYVEISSAQKSDAVTQTNITSDITIRSSQTLYNVQIGKSWTDELGQVYALAYLNRAETARIYLQKIEDNTARIMSYLAKSLDSSEAWSKYAVLNAAGIYDVATRSLLGQLSLISPAHRQLYEAPYDSEVLGFQISEAARGIKVRVETKGDTDAKVKPVLEQSITDLGFVIDPNADNKLVCVITIEPVDLNQDQKFVRYTLSVGIENEQGIKFITYADSGREGHISESEAYARAIRTINSRIQKQFVKMLNGYFDTLARK